MDPSSSYCQKALIKQKLSIQELYVKRAQILQKDIDNNDHMTTFKNYPIPFWLTTMTLTMIIII